MDSNLVVFSLSYTYLVNSLRGTYESKSGLWQNHSEWSKSLIPYNILESHTQTDVRVIDNLSRLRSTAEMLNHNGMGYQNHIKLVEPQLGNQLITVSISGNETFINNSRSEILKSFDSVGYKKIALPYKAFEIIPSFFTERLNSIALRYGVEIMISDLETDFNGQYVKSEKAHLYILGDTKVLGNAETTVNVLINSLLSDHFVDRVMLPLSMIPILVGVDMSNLKELTRESGICVYLPSLVDSLSRQHSLDQTEDIPVWLTGKSIAELVYAKDALTNSLTLVTPECNGSAKIYSQEIEISKEKLDFLNFHHKESILSIMLKYGTHIQRSSSKRLTSHSITIQGPTSISVKESSIELSALGCAFSHLDVILSHDYVSPDLEYYLIGLINRKKTCVLTCNEHGIRISGAQKEIQSLLSELAIDSTLNHYLSTTINANEEALHLVLNMELANDQRDFLSGKKNGKIIKILNQVAQVPKIEFLGLNEYNFLIRSSVRVRSKAKPQSILTAFQLLSRVVDLIEMELPAEVRFNIPEVFHKSIIGNGGCIIQAIMKKYNVFIKFFKETPSGCQTAEDSNSTQMISLFKRPNNVLIKCPLKNSKNIGFVKCEIDQLVQQCGQNEKLSFNGISAIYNTSEFKLLKSHYLLLLREMKFNYQFVIDWENEFSTFIDFPQSVTVFGDKDSIIVKVQGNENKAQLCAEKMAQSLPKSFNIEFSSTSLKFDEVFGSNSSLLMDLIVPFRSTLQTELSIYKCPEQGPDPTHMITLSSFDDGLLQDACSELICYLGENGIKVSKQGDAFFNPVISTGEIITSRTNSPRKNRSRSPRKSPQKSPQKSSQKSPTKARSNHGFLGSPVRGAEFACLNDKNPLGVITNLNDSPLIKPPPVFPSLENMRFSDK